MNFFDKFYIFFSKKIIPIFLKIKKINLGENTTFIGCPIISKYPKSSISFGANVSIISNGLYTALGINHPSVFRTLSENGKIEIGQGTGISGGTFCAFQSISVGENCLIGADVIIVDTDFHNVDINSRHDSKLNHIDSLPVKLGDNVFIGTKSIILKGVTIGENSVIGAGSIVTSSIPSNVIAAGNPCKKIKDLK